MNPKNETQIWQSRCYKLEDAIALVGLPCILKVRQEGGNDSSTYGKTVVRLEKKMTISLVRLKLPKFSEDNQSPTTGFDCEILVPLDYKGPVKLIAETKGKTYSSVRQLVKDCPSVVQLEEEAVSVLTESDEIRVLPSGSVLKLVRLLPASRARPSDGVMLIYSYQGKQYGFKLTFHIKCKAISTQVEMTLKEIVENLSLPRNIKFVDTKTVELPAQFSGKSSDMSTAVSGLLSMNAVESRRMLIGSKRTFQGGHELVLLPDDAENMSCFTSVQIPAQWSNQTMQNLTEEHFRGVDLNKHLHVIERKLYVFRDLEKPAVPSKHFAAKSSWTLPSSMEFTAERRDDYRLLAEKRSKAGFKKVHDQLKLYFAGILGKGTKKKMASQQTMYEEILDVGPSLSNAGCKESKESEECGSMVLHDKISSVTESSLQCEGHNTKTMPVTKGDKQNRVYDYPYFSISAGKPEPEIQCDESRINIPEEQNAEENAQELQSKIFYELRFDELVQILAECGMCSLAEMCTKQKLNGSFFEDISDKDLQKDPFNLSTFHINKVKAIIGGWRPKRSTNEI